MSLNTSDIQSLDRVDEQAVTDRIAATELPPQLQSVAQAYEEQVGKRDPFFWQWMYASMHQTRLSTVPSEHHETVAVLKTLAGMYDTVVDDIVDAVGEPRHLDTVAQIALGGIEAPDRELSADNQAVEAHLRFARRVWEEFESMLQTAPREPQFRPLLEFDIRQILMSMRYTLLVTDNPGMTNLDEGLGYQSHNLIHFLNADIDMMYSSAFDRADTGQLRRLIWDGQQLHRMINWIATWERELFQADFSSGVFALALREGVVDAEQLNRIRNGDGDPVAVREAITEHAIDQRLLEEWERRYAETFETASQIETESVDVVDYAIGVREVCRDTLAVKGDM